MGFWRKLGGLVSGEPSEEEIRRREKEVRKSIEEIKKREEYERSKIPFKNLFTHLDIDDLKQICEKVYGILPAEEEKVRDRNSDTGYQYYPIEMHRGVYENFIFEHIKFDQLKNFVIKNKMISPSHFADDPKIVGIFNEFEHIINSIQKEFIPEKFIDEKELQAQLAIFLKTKFPDMKIEREIITKRGDKLDIVVDDKYVVEVKIPENRTHLRNLSAQIEEYIEQYPNLCVVIADTSKMPLNDDVKIEANLTQNIKEYADKYKVRHAVQTLIFDIGKRK